MDEHTLDGDPPALLVEWNVGDRVLDQYEITGVHRGGMGVVYRARHLGWDVDVAVKRPRPELFRTPANRDRFAREARTWVDIGLHPHVCNCHYVRTIDGVPAVVAEYVHGGSLADWIRDRRLYAGSEREVFARIADLAVQAAWGLAHAHALGVVHRDVKPANILVGDDVKITDFGLAGAATGSYRGTRQYASPEQAAGKTTGTRSDVWSFAVSVLEMATGDVTWLAGPAAGGALAGLDLPRGLAALLGSCLEWDPANRPGDMAEVATALIELHEAGAGPFRRLPPSAAVLRADELNNRALSVLDLGHTADAVHLLDEALKADPRHPEATYNAGVLRWRIGKTTDDAVLTDLEATDPSRARPLIDLVRAERGDAPPDHTVHIGSRRNAAPVLVTPDGRLLLLGDGAGAVRVIEMATGACVRVLAGEGDEIEKIAVSSDGRQVIAASKTWEAALWDLAGGRSPLRKSSWGRTHDAFHLELSAEARTIMTTRLLGDLKTVRVQRLDSRRPARRLTAPSGVSALRMTADGRHALVGQNDGSVRAWDLTTGTAMFTLEGHTGPVNMIEIGAHHVVTAAGGSIGATDRTARLWDLRTGRCTHVLNGHTGSLTSISVTPDGRLALTGSGDRTARLWDLSTGACLQVFTGHTDIVWSVALPRDNPRLALTTELHGVVRVWEIETGRCLRTITDGVRFEDNALLTADERTLVHAGRTEVRLWRIGAWVPSPLRHARSRAAAELLTVSQEADDLLARAEREPERAHDLLRRARDLPGHERSARLMEAWRKLASARREFRTAWPSEGMDGGESPLTGICATSDGRVLSVGHDDNAVWVWDLSSRRRVATLAGHTERVRSVCASGSYVAATADDGTTRVWRSGELEHVLRGHHGPVRSVCATSDGQLLVTGGEDSTARVWELNSGRPVHVLRGHTGAIAAVLPTPDGRFCVTVGMRDRSVREWDLLSGRFTRFLETYPSQSLYSASITPEGHLLTVGVPSRQGVRVRDMASLELVRTLGRDTSSTMSHICTSPDGEIALVVESAGVIGVWEVATGRFRGHIEGTTGATDAVCFTPDGNHVLVAGDDGRIRAWDVDWELIQR